MTDKISRAEHWLYAPPDLADYEACTAEARRLRRTIAVLIAISDTTENRAYAAYELAQS